MILDRFMPSCKEVTDRLAEGEFDDAPWRKRMLIRMHLSMCGHCARFARQLKLIAEALREHWAAQPARGLLEALQSRILARLGGKP